MTKKLLFLPALFLLLLNSSVSNAQVLFSEDFTGAALPAGWSNDSLGQPAANLWLFNNPYTRVITGAGFDSNYALFDSDEDLTNDSILEYATLTTPSIDITSAVSSLFLELDEQFRSLAPPAGEAKRLIEYSVDAGLNWDTLVYDSLDYGYPSAVHSAYNLSSHVGVATDIIVRFTWSGDYDWWWALDNIQLISYPACTSPPEAGTANVSIASVCPSDSIHLSLVGADTGPQISYQWQSSSDSITWVSIAGGGSMSLTVFQSTESFYRCLVTCLGVDDSSSVVHVLMNPATSCYCVPEGVTCFGSIGNITNVTITGTTLNNSSGCDELTGVAYTFWPDLPSTSASLSSGTAYDFSVTADDDDIISIWIDLNLNGGFESTEWTQVCTTSVAGVANTVNILIPTSATQGPTRMRVRSRWINNQNDAGSSCLLFGSGEAEDYVIGIDFAVGLNKIPLKGTGIYPNPNTGMAYVMFENTIPNASISVYDHIGRLIQNKIVSNVFSTNLDLSAESNGLYFIRIETAEGSVTHKLIMNK